jgi:hypothetical protein
VIQTLNESAQAIVIEVDPAGIPDNAWKAIDCIEAYIAFAYKGIIYAPDEGFYDAGLALMCPCR